MPSLPPLRADHVLVGTPDYDATLAWYRRALDAQVEKEGTVPEVPDLRLAYLRVGNFRLEVIGSRESTPGAPRARALPSHLRTAGYAHLCFAVDAVMSALAERGVPAFFPATDFPNVGVRVGFVQDDQGNAIEFSSPMK